MQMRSPDGASLVKCGVYREIVPPEWLVFTYAWEDAPGTAGPQTLVTIRLEVEGSRTRLTLHQAVFETTALRDLQRDGWTRCLEHLRAYLAAA